LLEIKLFVVTGSFTGCVFVPQVYLHHEFRCCSRACESAVNVIRVFTNAAAVIQDLIPIMLRFSRHVEVVGMSLFWSLNGQFSQGQRN